LSRNVVKAQTRGLARQLIFQSPRFNAER